MLLRVESQMEILTRMDRNEYHRVWIIVAETKDRQQALEALAKYSLMYPTRMVEAEVSSNDQ